MRFENQIGNKFDNLAQRLVYSYMASYSQFVPTNTDEITIEAQKQTHDFLSGLLFKIYHNPAIIGLPLEKDDCFDGEAFKDKPELVKTMKNLEKKFLGFFNLLFELGIAGEIKNKKLYISNIKIKLQKSRLNLLEQIGFKSEIMADTVIIYSKEYTELCSGLKSLSEICKSSDGKDITKQSMTREIFMKCLFDEKNISLTNLYGDLAQSGIYLKELEEYFINKGYEIIRYDISFRLQKAYPNKQSGSFAVMFNWRCKNQLSYVVDVPSLRVLMEHFDEIDDELRELVFSRTNTCENCGYCTQTGKRVIVALQLNHNGKAITKCPYYPSFNWNSLDEKAVSSIKKLCDFAEDILYRVYTK